ncbi:MAG: hypothetical protein KGJ62_15485 [Armatimonadetes bacterium]|nr:hypothetical protein [Armatimonadota bacterium]MDE2207465.1 hypothetical protein [Armatimonadota bacterium]
MKRLTRKLEPVLRKVKRLWLYVRFLPDYVNIGVYHLAKTGSDFMKWARSLRTEENPILLSRAKRLRNFEKSKAFLYDFMTGPTKDSGRTAARFNCVYYRIIHKMSRRQLWGAMVAIGMHEFNLGHSDYDAWMADSGFSRLENDVLARRLYSDSIAQFNRPFGTCIGDVSIGQLNRPFFSYTREFTITRVLPI